MAVQNPLKHIGWDGLEMHFLFQLKVIQRWLAMDFLTVVRRGVLHPQQHSSLL